MLPALWAKDLLLLAAHTNWHVYGLHSSARKNLKCKGYRILESASERRAW